MGRAAPAIRLLPALLMTVLLGAGAARADSSDELQIDGAIADFDKALEIAPYLAAAFQRRGDARFRRGLAREAIEDFDRALERDAHIARAVREMTVT